MKHITVSGWSIRYFGIELWSWPLTQGHHFQIWSNHWHNTIIKTKSIQRTKISPRVLSLTLMCDLDLISFDVAYYIVPWYQVWFLGGGVGNSLQDITICVTSVQRLSKSLRSVIRELRFTIDNLTENCEAKIKNISSLWPWPLTQRHQGQFQ